VTPRIDELRYLTHVRHVHLADKPAPGPGDTPPGGSTGDGLFSLVVANRFPASPPPGSPPNTTLTAIAHLVSLEGYESVLVDEPDWTGHTSVAMLSLASFSFSVQAEEGTDFRDLVAGLVASETVEGTQHPKMLLLQVPVPAAPLVPPQDRFAAYATAGDPPAAVEMARRLTDGFVPLEYQTRAGESTVAWYRGPFSPVPTAPLVGDGGPPVFPTADAALAYAPAFGVFDVSLGAAFTTGRALALSDRVFGQDVVDLRRRAATVADEVAHRLTSAHFAVADLAAAVRRPRIFDVFGPLLDDALIGDLGAGPVGEPAGPATPPPPAPTAAPDAVAALQDALARPEVQAAILDDAAQEFDAVTTWLASLILLEPVPFVALVAHDLLLPSEGLRFFYLDRNWLSALLDGALAVGLDSTKAGTAGRLLHDQLVAAAWVKALARRDQLTGRAAASAAAGDSGDAGDVGDAATPITGLLLRSAMVSGWPTLEVRGTDAAGAQLPVLRMAHLAPSVLLCLFLGVPHEVEFAEPTEGLRFGTDDAGDVGLRNPIAPSGGQGLALGAPLAGAAPFPLIDLHGDERRQMRDTTHRVMNLAPSSPTGMVQSLQAALAAALGSAVPALGPADLAVQLIAAPDAVTFDAPTQEEAVSG
jgi:hypothetical protein